MDIVLCAGIGALCFIIGLIAGLEMFNAKHNSIGVFEINESDPSREMFSLHIMKDITIDMKSVSFDIKRT